MFPTTRDTPTRNHAVVPRAIDELEGTLLLPMASSVVIPVSQEDQVPTLTARLDKNNYSIDANDSTPLLLPPMAPSIPEYDTREGRERAMSQQVAIGERYGLQMAELEKEKLRKAQGNVFAINYHAERKIKEANRNARERNRQGFELPQHDSEIQKPNDSKAEDCYESAFQIPHDGGGYEVTEYTPNEYVAETDYQISDYKSIYD